MTVPPPVAALAPATIGPILQEVPMPPRAVLASAMFVGAAAVSMAAFQPADPARGGGQIGLACGEIGLTCSQSCAE